MRKPHNVVLQKADGGVEVYRLKQWLRGHPEFLPPDMHPDTSTSHELRRALAKQGWGIEEHSDQVLIIKPNDRNETSFVAEVLGADADEPDTTEAEEITFGLERDLQIALRASIGQLEPGLTIVDEGRERITEAGRKPACPSWMGVILVLPEQVKPRADFDVVRDDPFNQLFAELRKGMNVQATFEGRFEAVYTWRNQKQVWIGEGQEKPKGFGKKGRYGGRIVLHCVSDILARPVPRK